MVGRGLVRVLGRGDVALQPHAEGHRGAAGAALVDRPAGSDDERGGWKRVG